MDIWIYGFQIPISEGIKLPSTDKLYPCRQGKNIPKAEAHHLSAGKRKPYIPIKSYPPLWKKKKKKLIQILLLQGRGSLKDANKLLDFF